MGVRFNPNDFPYRTADGTFNDPFNEGAGGEGTFFGRNMPPVDQKDKVFGLTNLMVQNYKACMVQILFKVICS